MDELLLLPHNNTNSNNPNLSVLKEFSPSQRVSHY